MVRPRRPAGFRGFILRPGRRLGGTGGLSARVRLPRADKPPVPPRNLATGPPVAMPRAAHRVRGGGPMPDRTTLAVTAVLLLALPAAGAAPPGPSRGDLQSRARRCRQI